MTTGAELPHGNQEGIDRTAIDKMTRVSRGNNIRGVCAAPEYPHALSAPERGYWSSHGQGLGHRPSLVGRWREK